MKYFVTIIFIYLTTSVYSQISINEMMKIYEMNMDQFETFSLGKGYHFVEARESGFVYGKDFGKYISKHFGDNKYVHQQTSNVNEYLKFKNQIQNIGFVFKESKSFEKTSKKGVLYKSLTKNYIKGKWQIILSSVENGQFDIILNQQ